MRSLFWANLHTYTRTNACTHHMIRARMGSHLQRNLFNFQTFNLVLIFIHAHKPHPFSNRFTCSFFSLFDVNILCRKERNAWKKCEMNFWCGCMFFSLIFSPKQNQMLHLVTNVPRCISVDEEVKNDKITSEFDDKK